MGLKRQETQTAHISIFLMLILCCISGIRIIVGILIAADSHCWNAFLLLRRERIRKKLVVQPQTQRTPFPSYVCIRRVIHLTIQNIFTDDKYSVIFLCQNKPFDILLAIVWIIILLVTAETHNISDLNVRVQLLYLPRSRCRTAFCNWLGRCCRIP